MASEQRHGVCTDAQRIAQMIRIDEAWLSTEAMDMRAGMDTLFGCIHLKYPYPNYPKSKWQSAHNPIDRARQLALQKHLQMSNHLQSLLSGLIDPILE